MLMAFAALAVGVGGVVLGGAAPAVPAVGEVGEIIHNYEVALAVQDSGELEVTETIDYDFGINSRHGIFRDIPTRFRFSDTKNRVYPIDHIDVEQDGNDVPIEEEQDGSNLRIRIGDPDKTITGEHRYEIQYIVRGALNSFDTHEELYWNIIGSQWEVPIEQATATVTGPADIQQVECFAGPTGSQLSCSSETFTGTTANFSAGPLPVEAGMTVVVAFPEGSVRNTDPVLEKRHDLAAAFRATPWTVGGGVGVALLGVAGALGVAWLVGRDKSYISQVPGLTPVSGQDEREKRRSLFGRPPIAVEFTPPDKIRPGQVGTLIDERANTEDVTATIIDFAVRKHLHIRELPREGLFSRQDWELIKQSDGDPAFLSYERTLFDALFRGRNQVLLSELKNTFAADLSTVQRMLYSDMVSEGWYRRSPAAIRSGYRVLGILGIVVAAGLTWLLAQFTQFALVGIGLIVAAVVLFFAAGFMPARTGKGSAMLARVLGFRQYLTTAEANQIKFEEREEIFSRYLPYAIVFGVAERWASIFGDLGARQADGSSGLYWYAGLSGWSMLYFTQSIGSFTTSTSGTIASTPSASGSSGFGGGGFSGGGGGGGGGGSW